MEIPNGHSHISLYASLAASLQVKTMFNGLFADAELDLMLKESLTLHLNHQEAVSSPGFGQLTVRSLWLESGIIGDVIISESIADYHGNPCTTTTGPPLPPPPPTAAKGWMTGGGRLVELALTLRSGRHRPAVGDAWDLLERGEQRRAVLTLFVDHDVGTPS